MLTTITRRSPPGGGHTALAALLSHAYRWWSRSRCPCRDRHSGRRFLFACGWRPAVGDRRDDRVGGRVPGGAHGVLRSLSPRAGAALAGSRKLPRRTASATSCSCGWCRCFPSGCQYRGRRCSAWRSLLYLATLIASPGRSSIRASFGARHAARPREYAQLGIISNGASCCPCSVSRSWRWARALHPPARSQDVAVRWPRP